jgi:hypothetical protein
MGWCHEFGATVREGCGHPMTAGESSCECAVCGVVCGGKFTGCAAVWARGPREAPLLPPTGSDVLPGPEAPMALALRRHPLPEPETELLSRASTTAVATVDDDQSGDLQWLREAFEGMRAELRVLRDAVSRQEQTLAVRAEADAAAERLVALADELPDRIGLAVSEAVRSAVERERPEKSSDGPMRRPSVGGPSAWTIGAGAVQREESADLTRVGEAPEAAEGSEKPIPRSAKQIAQRGLERLAQRFPAVTTDHEDRQFAFSSSLGHRVRSWTSERP